MSTPFFSLEGKVCVITGASSGFGVAFADRLARAGADIALGARRVERLEETKKLVESYGRRALARYLDVTDPESCEAFAQATFEEFGHLDVLVNNAGVGTSVPAIRETPEQFSSVVETNLHGSYWMSQSCGRLMQPGSSIINIGSVLGVTTAGLPQAAYAASKAAIIGLTRDLAQQWATRRGIRVNAIAPGYFPTEMTSEYSPEYLEKIRSTRVPIDRMGQLEECAAGVHFLASDDASFITGILLPIDGGLLTT